MNNSSAIIVTAMLVDVLQFTNWIEDIIIVIARTIIVIVALKHVLLVVA